MMSEHTEVENEIQAGIAEFVARYPFPLDPFQLDAMEILAHGQSVLVAAPTGTGKTLVAEFAVWLAQQRGQRVIYTTPLKALSNQKYRDLRDLYGDEAVGLVTGDIVERSRAPIVIMTTEVYRNMLLEEGGVQLLKDASYIPSELADVGFVIFDELHYLSDVERGPVWEEAIICSPRHVQLVGLSATVSNAPDLAEWISRVHAPIELVVHEQRAVPLDHYYFLDNKLHLVENAEGERVERFPNVGGEARLAKMMAAIASTLSRVRKRRNCGKTSTGARRAKAGKLPEGPGLERLKTPNRHNRLRAHLKVQELRREGAG